MNLSCIDRWVKYLTIIQVFFIVYALLKLVYEGRLPTPFFYASNDTFMDLFNTNYWARNTSRFEEWRSIYPMFVFFLSRLSDVATCEVVNGPVQLRECDGISIYLLISSSLSACYFCAKKHTVILNKIVGGRRNTVMLFILFSTSLPFLWAVERGNYILISFAFLSFSAYASIWWLSAIFLAFAINIKQYLLVFLLIPFLQRRWHYLFVLLATGVFVNIVSLIAIAEPKYDLIIENMSGFAVTLDGSFFEKIWNPTSLVGWNKVLEYSPHVHEIINRKYVDIFLNISDAILLSARLISICAVFGMILKSEKLSSAYMALILLILLMVNTDALGGYSLILLYPFLNGFAGRPFAKQMLFMVFILLLPIEIPVGFGIEDDGISWLTGKHVHEYMSISLGSLLRPWILLVLLGTIVVDLMPPKYFLTKSIRET